MTDTGAVSYEIVEETGVPGKRPSTYDKQTNTLSHTTAGLVQVINQGGKKCFGPISHPLVTKVEQDKIQVAPFTSNKFTGT